MSRTATNGGYSTNGARDAVHADVDDDLLGEATVSTSLPCVDVLDLDRAPLPEPAFVVDYLFPQGAVVLFSGDSGSCKTAFMLHASFAIPFADFVGSRFTTMPAAGPVLYFNGELDPALLQITIRQAAAGFGRRVHDTPRGSFIFGGECGMTSLRFRADFSDAATERAAFEALIDEKQPALVVLDTQRALFELDEKEAAQVRAEFTWLKRLAADYRCCIVVLHHLRKMGAMNNGERERVSGSRDLIASVDVHLSAKSDNGRPMRALYVDKTRYPKDGVLAGTEFPVQSIFEPPSRDRIGRSTFVVAGPTLADAAIESESAHERDMLARFERERLLTRNDLGAGDQGSGAQRRAFTALERRGRIVKSGQKRRRSDLWKRADARDELFPQPGASEPGPQPGPAPGPVHPEIAQTPAVQGFEPGPRTGPPVGLDGPADRPDGRDAPAPPQAGAPASHQSEKRTGPTGPTPIGGPGSRGPVREGVPADRNERKACAFPVGAPGARFCRHCGVRTDAHLSSAPA